MNEVTRILSAIEQGDPDASEQLLPLVYEELRKLAGQKLAQEKAGQTLQATALVHEAYPRLALQNPPWAALVKLRFFTGLKPSIIVPEASMAAVAACLMAERSALTGEIERVWEADFDLF